MLISSVFAEATISPPTHPVARIMPQLLIFIGFIFLFYFLVWQPQTKRQQDKQALLSALRVGDVVYTNGGIVGKIVNLHQDFYELKVGANLHLHVRKEAITELVPQDSLKALGF